MAIALAAAGLLGSIGIVAATSKPPQGADSPGARAASGQSTGGPATPGAGVGARPPVVTGALGPAGPGHPTTAIPAASAAPTSPAIPAQPPLSPPLAPLGLTATPGNGQARLCWTPGARAGGYVVYQRDATANEAWKRLPYPVSGPCWSAGLLINLHTYQYKLRSGNQAGESGFSNTVSVRPAGPKPAPATALTATPTNGGAKLCWKPGAQATGYLIYVRNVTTNSAWTQLPYPVPGPCWSDSLLVNGNQYAYKLRSGNPWGESGFSNTALVTPHP